jgi:hypothetical protein
MGAPMSPISSSRSCFRRRSRLFRLARYEDLRHLLKHKRRYAPDALTAAERRVLARKSYLTRVWMATGKKVYYAITRGLNVTDREGRGMRFTREAPAIAARLMHASQVRDVAIVAFPDRRAGTGLYAFVEGSADDRELRDFLGNSAPEHLADRRRLATQCARAKCAAKFSNSWP